MNGETRRDSPYQKLAEHLIKLLNHNKADNHTITCKIYDELRGLSGNNYARTQDRYRVNNWFERHKLGLYIAPGKPGRTVIVRRNSEMAHSEIIRKMSLLCNGFVYGARHLEALSESENLPEEGKQNLEKAAKLIEKTRTAIAKQINNIGLPESIRQELVDNLIPIVAQPWGKSKDEDYPGFQFDPEKPA